MISEGFVSLIANGNFPNVMKHQIRDLFAVTLAKCNFGSMDRFRLQTRPLRSFWGPSRLFQRRNFSFDPSSFTQNENPKLRWKGESKRFHPISVRRAKISVFELQTDRFFVLKWFIFALTKPRRPKYQPVTTETVHFLLSWESSRFWNDRSLSQIRSSGNQ